MTLVRFKNPYYPANKSLVDDLFNSLSFNDAHAGYSSYQAATNIAETENDFRLELILPGFKKDEISLNFHKDILTVKAEKDQKAEDQKAENYLRREFGAGTVEKQFNIPETVDAEKINAKFESGILEIILPKKEEAVEKSPLAISIS